MLHRISLTLCALVCASSFASEARAQVTKKITTLFANNNSGAIGWGNFFDLRVTNESGIAIKSFEVNVIETTPFTIDFYTCATTYVGNNTNAAAWTLRGSASGTGAGSVLPSVMALATPVSLAPGSYGVAIYYHGGTPNYTNGTGTNNTYFTTDVSLALGISMTALFSGTVFTPRIWNGSIIYDIVASSSTFRTFGSGCTGSNGVPSLDQAPGSWPDINKTVSLAFTNLPATPGAFSLLLGVSSTYWLGLPLPFDLTLISMPGCNVYNSGEVIANATNTGGVGTFALPIPNNAGFLYARIYVQGFILDASANLRGATTTNSAELGIGR